MTAFRRLFWELDTLGDAWALHVSSPDGNKDFTGMHFISRWEQGVSGFATHPETTIRGRAAWGKEGVACAWLGRLPVGRYLGTIFDNSAAAIIAKDPMNLGPIWCFMSSPEFSAEIRKINQKTQVANATLVRIPFDLARWKREFSIRYPDGLPEPSTDDPTQWLFCGNPNSREPLQVGLARLIGYQWPRQTGVGLLNTRAIDAGELAPHTDTDGIVCLTALKGEPPAEQRLNALLADAFGAGLVSCEALKPTGRCRLCRQITRRLAARRLFRPALRAVPSASLHLAHLGWATRRVPCAGQLPPPCCAEWRRPANAGEADLLLSRGLDRPSARRAKGRQRRRGRAPRSCRASARPSSIKILEGEPPYDIFVRWKPLHEQPIGWDPDINDGVRINIRPFMIARTLNARGANACILRATPKIKWDKDRGKEPPATRRTIPGSGARMKPPRI